jgi:hypothetical protein
MMGGGEGYDKNEWKSSEVHAYGALSGKEAIFTSGLLPQYDSRMI